MLATKRLFHWPLRSYKVRMKVKKGDNIIIVAGKDKGKTGTIVRTFPQTDQVLVDGVNVITKHQKNRRRRSQGQIIEKSAPVHVSNVALVEDGKAVRVGYKTEGEGEKATKVRVSRKTGKTL